MGGMLTRRPPKTGNRPGRAAVRPARSARCAPAKDGSSCSRSFRHAVTGRETTAGRSCSRPSSASCLARSSLSVEPAAGVVAGAELCIAHSCTVRRLVHTSKGKQSRRRVMATLQLVSPGEPGCSRSPPADDLHTLCEQRLSQGRSDGSLAAGPRHHGCRGPATTRSPRPATIAWPSSSARSVVDPTPRPRRARSLRHPSTPPHVLGPSPTPAATLSPAFTPSALRRDGYAPHGRDFGGVTSWMRDPGKAMTCPDPDGHIHPAGSARNQCRWRPTAA